MVTGANLLPGDSGISQPVCHKVRIALHLKTEAQSRALTSRVPFPSPKLPYLNETLTRYSNDITFIVVQ